MAKATNDTIQETSNYKGSERKKCFIISPFGSDGSDTRRKAEGLIDAVIKPVLQRMEFDTYSSLDISKTSSITHQVNESLLNDDLVVANLTGLNPNVMYELAVRHAKRKPVISLVEKGTILPFDISQERTIFYDNDMRGVFDLQPSLKDAVEAAMIDDKIDNPIYRVIQQNIIQEHVKVGSFEDLILNKLNEIQEKVSLRKNLNSARITNTMIDANYCDKVLSDFPVVSRFSIPGESNIIAKLLKENLNLKDLERQTINITESADKTYSEFSMGFKTLKDQHTFESVVSLTIPITILK